MEKGTRCTPVVKWAGGKRQLVDRLIEKMPEKYGTYYEPFFGGGALYFTVEPKKAVINDFNYQLINMYSQIEDNPVSLIKTMVRIQNKYNKLNSDDERKDYYYKLREKYNRLMKYDPEGIDSAALFIILNKLGYNGLYRVNSKGEFNVPWSKRKKINAFDEHNIYAVRDLLENTEILNEDFEDAIKGIKKNDFVFFDSPYYDTFDTYQAGGFSENDHIRLAELFKKLSSKGIYCMLTNSDTDFIKDLYREYNIDIVDVKRMINCNGKSRTGREVIITNYAN